MIFQELPILNAFLITLIPKNDERGSFERLFCQEEFKNQNLHSEIKQVNCSHNSVKGTFRGMHFQSPPYEEAKLVQCIQGSIFDVILDLRTHSSTYMQCHSVELTATSHNGLYIPEGVAHGFLTLRDHSTVLYHMFHAYQPDYATGVRWNDPAFEIELPIEPTVISENDASFPLYQTEPR